MTPHTYGLLQSPTVCYPLHLLLEGEGVDVGCHDGEGGGDVEARGRLSEQRRRLAVQIDDKALSRVLRMDMGTGTGTHIQNMRAHET